MDSRIREGFKKEGTSDLDFNRQTWKESMT